MKIESVKQLLIECAVEHTTITYHEMIRRHKLSRSTGSYYKLFNLLAKVGDIQYEDGKPLLNSLVVGSDSLPGDGFF